MDQNVYRQVHWFLLANERRLILEKIGPLQISGMKRIFAAGYVIHIQQYFLMAAVIISADSVTILLSSG